MLNLRMNGWSIHALAIIFDCDRSSIREQCDKYGVLPASDEVFYIRQIVAPAIQQYGETSPVSKWYTVDGERVNRGMSYRDYLLKYPPRIKAQ